MLALCRSGSKIDYIVEDEVDLCEYFDCIENTKTRAGRKQDLLLRFFRQKLDFND
jgi:hypothetical protein